MGGDDSNKTAKEKEAKVEDDVCVDTANYSFEGNDEKDCNWAKEKRILKCKRVDKKTEKPISFHCPSVCNDACRDIAAPSVDSKTTAEKKENVASKEKKDDDSKTTPKKENSKVAKEREEGGDIKGDDSNKTAKEKEAKVEDDVCVDTANYSFEGNDEKDCNWAKE